MPKKLNVDWQLAQSLYLQGIRYKEISERLDIPVQSLQSKASKSGWTKLMAETKAQMVLGEARALEAVSETVKSKFAKRLFHLASTLPDYPLPLKEELQIQQKLEPAIRNARTILGWKEGNNQPSVRINVMAGASVITTESPKSIEGKESILLPEASGGEKGEGTLSPAG